jgi:hypothetical protein
MVRWIGDLVPSPARSTSIALVELPHRLLQQLIMHSYLPMPSRNMPLEVVAAVESPLGLRAERTQYPRVPVDARDVPVQRIQSLETLPTVGLGADINRLGL